MDKTLKAKIIKDVLLDHIGGYEQPLVNVPVFDDVHQRYMLITKSTEDSEKLVYQVLCAVVINPDGKVAVEFNRSDIDLKDMFLSGGVPYADLV
jgi:hypothetical protein